MTYKMSQVIPFLHYIRQPTSNSAQHAIDYGYEKNCGDDSKCVADGGTPYSLYYFCFPPGLTERDVIHVRAGIKETAANQGFKIHLTSAHTTYSSATEYVAITLNPDDTANEADFPVAQSSARVTSTLVTAVANGTPMRSWVGPAAASSGSSGDSVKMHGLIAWVEKNVGGP